MCSIPIHLVTKGMVEPYRSIWVLFIPTIYLHLNKQVLLPRIWPVVSFNESDTVVYTVHGYCISNDILGLYQLNISPIYPCVTVGCSERPIIGLK